MTVPKIKPGGSTKEQLLGPLDAAIDALEVAIEKLKKTAPNTNDYELGQVQPASLGYFRRLYRLQAVQEELTELWRAIAAQ